MGPPQGWLGGFVPTRPVLARTGEVAVLLDALQAFPTGVSFQLLVLSRQLGEVDRPLFHSDSDLRFGVAFPDGSKWQGLARGFSPSKAPPGPSVMFLGGGGSDHEYQQHLWLWPLPPAGPVTFALTWPAMSIVEATVQIDGAVFQAAAAEAQQLWQPLSPEEEAAAIRERFDRASGGRFGLMVAYSDPDAPKGGA